MVCYIGCNVGCNSDSLFNSEVQWCKACNWIQWIQCQCTGVFDPGNIEGNAMNIPGINNDIV